MPNFELMKTPMMSPMQEDCPPSYHLPPYTPPHHTPCPTLLGKTTTSSKPLPPNTTPTMPRLRRSKRIMAAAIVKTTKMTQA